MWTSWNRARHLVVSFTLLISLVNCAKKPNIVFILADDYGWNDIGYHNPHIHTPELDELAASGVKLNNYYVQPICTPSRSQLLSGRYQIHTGLQHSIIHVAQPSGLPVDIPTIADVVKSAGYSTHMVGKWHLGFYKKEFTPLNRGFDTFYGYLSGSEDYFRHTRCTNRGLTRRLCGKDLRDGHTPDGNQTGRYSTHLFADKAKEVIVNYAESKTDKPMFLYLAFQAVHIPLQVPSVYLDRYANVTDSKRRHYSAMTTCMDEAVANVTRQLKASGLWDDTVLIFSSDNGGSELHGANNWPLRGGKGTLWEGGIRSLGFVTGGDNINFRSRGSVNTDLMHITDWFPTIARLAEADVTGLQLDGYDIWDTISDEQPTKRKEILHNIDPKYGKRGEPRTNSSFSTNIRSAIRIGDWKLITGNPGRDAWVPEPPFAIGKSDNNVFLFNVADDPYEESEISDLHPEVVDRLLERLAYHSSTMVPAIFPPYDTEGSDPKQFGGFWSPWMD